MSGLPETRKLWMTPLSPVHMETDEDYSPTGYVIEGNVLFEFDQQALENLPENERKKLNTILDRKATPDMLKQVQAFFHHNRNWLIPAAVNIVPVSEEMAKLYEARIGKAANVESGGKQVLNALEIERAAYNPLDRRLFLPGSGLKGAMRTALLDAVNNGQRAQHKERNRELQQRLFQYTMREINKDPMRLVQVGDCCWQGPEALNSAEVLFAVNRKKQPVQKHGKLVQSQAEQRNLYQMLECAAPFRFRAFQGTLNITNPGSVIDKHKLPELRFSFGEIATACNRYYRPIFEEEAALLKTRGYLDTSWRETVETLLGDTEIQSRLKNNDAFLLRVGRHSGAESVTVNGARSIKIMQGKGEKPKWESETKTIWLATESLQDKRFLRPFGWLLVEMTELDEKLPAWQKAEQLIQQQTTKMTKWLADITHRQNELKQKLIVLRTEQHRIEQEQQAQQEKERQEKQQAERELAEKLAALPEDAAELEQSRTQWTDNNQFLDSIESFLENRDHLTKQAHAILNTELEKHWKGIMADPEAVQGKKNKPKYKPRPKALALKVIELQPS